MYSPELAASTSTSPLTVLQRGKAAFLKQAYGQWVGRKVSRGVERAGLFPDRMRPGAPLRASILARGACGVCVV
jgi:hypothetical protein